MGSCAGVTDATGASRTTTARSRGSLKPPEFAPGCNVRGASQKRGRGIDLVTQGDPELVNPQRVERLETVGGRKEDRRRDERAGAERYELRRIAELDYQRPDLRMQRAIQLTERDPPLAAP